MKILYAYLFCFMFLPLFSGQAIALEEHKDIAYVEGSELYRHKLDIYTPFNKTSSNDADKVAVKRPVVIYVHGGGWTGGDKKSVKTDMAKSFTREDVIVVAPNYRLAPKEPFPLGMQDLASAVKWVHDHIAAYQGDPNNIALVGFSSGAHMVALLSVDPSYLGVHDLNPELFKSVFAVDTASFDLTTKKTGDKARLVNFLVLRAFGDNPETLKKASPLHQLAEAAPDSLPPFHIYVTASRQEAMLESQAFMEVLLQKEADVEFHVLGESMLHADMKDAIFDLFSPLHKNIMSMLSK